MESYRINGEKITMPTGWHDVKFKDAFKLLKENLNAVDTFSLFSGIPSDEVRKLDSEPINYFISSFTFLKELPDTDPPKIPRSVKVGGEYRILPFAMFNDKFDLGKSSVGQVEDMKQVIVNELKKYKEGEDIPTIDLIEMMPKLVAIYLQPVFQMEYDFDKAQKFEKRIQKASFLDVYQIGSFFLKKLTDSTNGSLVIYQKVNPILKKFRLAYRTLINYLDSIIR